MAERASETRDFSLILRESLRAFPEYDGEVEELLLPLVGSIGRNDLLQQVRVLENVIDALGRARDRWEEKHKKEGGLYRRLGFLGGIAAVVILL